jgi:hypothetical protein
MNRMLKLAALFVFVVGFGTEAYAQKNKGDIKLEFKEIKVIKKRFDDGDDQSIPGIRSDTKSEFVLVLLAYDLDLKGTTGLEEFDNFIDHCEFEWSVVMARPSRTGTNMNEKYSIRLNKTVIYSGLEKGEDKLALVMLDPYVYKRFSSRFEYKKNLYVQLRVKVDGVIVGQLWATERGKKMSTSFKSSRTMFPRTKSGASWFDSADVRQIKGGLMDKKNSPFEWSSFGKFGRIIEVKE